MGPRIRIHNWGLLAFAALCIVSQLEAQVLYTHSSVYPKKYCPKGVYSGLLNDREEPQGNGTYTCKRYTYHGQWTQGKRNGVGLTEFSNGDIHAGSYYMDKFNGWGDFEWKNDRRYVGQFRDGKRDGRGEMTFPNGDKYIGDWLKGARTGHGFYTFNKSGNRYKGGYLSGQKVGEGVFWWTSGRHAGSKYRGESLNDRRHGDNGKYYYSNGDVYIGSWQEGRQNGSGELTFSNGNKIQGQWLKGKLNGEETYFIFPNGERYKGKFENGNRIGDWVKVNPAPFDLSLLYSTKKDA
uniref:Phosphatidylinositol-4-phosphate 5-kinase 5 n=1 Tax=Caligus clemensi TaxID=344056 RepID=C1C1Z4_CALCM|nr:Phosphatidylinositol-4-phosphate 5-kinase 5 [Caligus clemensi]